MNMRPTAAAYATPTVPEFQQEILAGVPDTLPDEMPYFDPSHSDMPAVQHGLDEAGCVLAVANALRFVDPALHEEVAPLLADELEATGHVYGGIFRPNREIYARPEEEYPGKILPARGMMSMFENNLDRRVAAFPRQLSTYGGARVFSNWMEYRLFMQMMAQLGPCETLYMASGRPHLVVPTSAGAPRLILTNGMRVSNFATPEWCREVGDPLGVFNYGQMTCGSGRYIGSQGIIHGTVTTFLNAGRLYMGIPPEENLAGKLIVTSGLGGMSGAQAKAATICGAVVIIAEMDMARAIDKQKKGWLMEIETDLEKIVARAGAAKAAGEALSIAYVGNVVDLWEYLARHDIKVDLGTDQTSSHIPWEGGYWPVGLTLAEARKMLKEDKVQFRELVYASYIRQKQAIDTLHAHGMPFIDYGNFFLGMVEEAFANASTCGIMAGGQTLALGTLFPSYTEHLMQPICFDYGFGPFRWICLSQRREDLLETDRIAAQVLEKQLRDAPPEIRQQIQDNLDWIRKANDRDLVIGSQARILYANMEGRLLIAQAFNKAIREGRIGPVALSRDDHDTSGTDSPWRETRGMRDGSAPTADMAVLNWGGLIAAGVTWATLHDGGGTGIGNAVNGGFGHILDGKRRQEQLLKRIFFMDIINGIVRRAWAGNPGAQWTLRRALAMYPELSAHLPHRSNSEVVQAAVARSRRDRRP